MNMNFKGDARALNIVHFQKGKVFWNQLDEIYHFSWVHKQTKKLHFQREPPTETVGCLQKQLAINIIIRILVVLHNICTFE